MAAAGLMAVQALLELQLTELASNLPKMNFVLVPSAKPLPLMLTVLPPALGPSLGLTAVTVGGPYL